MSKVKMILSMLAMAVAIGTANASIIEYSDSVDAFNMNDYAFTFRAGEAVTLVVAGDGSSDLDLYIYDSSGELIDYDDGFGDSCVASWEPELSGSFTIVVENHGSLINQFHMYTL